MARRFGRNQRRQLREQVSKLTHEVGDRSSRISQLVREKSADSMRFRRLAANLVDELPEDSALLEELRVELLYSWPPMRGRRAEVRGRGKVRPRDFIKQAAINDETCAIRIIELVTYQLQVSEDLLADRIRFMVVNDKTDAVAYCVDARSFMSRGFTDRMVGEMAERIARELAGYHQKMLHG